MTRATRVRPRVCLSAALLIAGLAVAPLPSAAQAAVDQTWDPAATDLTRDWSDEVPAHVSWATEETWLEREGTVEAAPLNVPLLAGDRLRTADGHLEILFSDGSRLSLDRHSEAELLSDTLMQLDRGAARIELARGSAGYRIDAAGTTTWARTAGDYLVEVDPGADVEPMVRLLVIRGTAELESNAARSLVRAGYEAWAAAGREPSLPRASTVAGTSDFARWWDDRRDERLGYRSSSYLPAELTSYSGVLDRDGSWEYESDYGYVWYPRVVTGWTPYSSGRWTYVGVYGWVWIGADRWAWPTHHYGRWGHRHGRYYWIPGRHWAPAWVAWATAPGYVGWVPLGFDNRPLISIHIGYSSGWRGWTYAPVDRFRGRVVVAHRGRYVPPAHVQLRHAYSVPVRPATLVSSTSRVIRGPSAPPRGPVAVPRAGIRSAAPGVGPAPIRSARTPSVTRQAPAVRPAEGARTSAPSRSVAAPRAGVPAVRQSGSTRPAPSRVAAPPSRTTDRAGVPSVGGASRPAASPRVGTTRPSVQEPSRLPSRAPSRTTPPARTPATRVSPPVPRSAPAVRPGTPRVATSPARVPSVRSRAPEVQPTPGRVERSRAVPARVPEGRAGGISTPSPRSIERAPSRTIERAPAPRVQRTPQSSPPRVQAPAPSSRAPRPATRGGESPRGESPSRAGGRAVPRSRN